MIERRRAAKRQSLEERVTALEERATATGLMGIRIQEAWSVVAVSGHDTVKQDSGEDRGGIMHNGRGKWVNVGWI